ncbi:MAG: tetraacyldisaccharide 4'-kinase [Rubrivivax sp.]|nr:tetraacyldisaccharide 4'-kinase [Rubrivivax sp.]
MTARSPEAATLRERLEAGLARIWWRARPGGAAWLLWPLTWPYRAGAAISRRLAGSPADLPVPVVVVGNVVVGGVGKTPIVIALVKALRASGRVPGVVSRGHGRQAGADIVTVGASSNAAEVGDEPLLVHRRTAAPVFVGRRRAAAAAALCAAHPDVDVIVSDDGLQHLELPRAAELIVFDDRGVGNGLLLPAGPLRQPLPRALARHTFVVYSGKASSTPLPGRHAARRAEQVWPLRAWGTRPGTGAATPQPLAALRGRRLVALAGIGAPAQFFAMLEAAGLDIVPLARPDHADYRRAPWPAGTPAVITTEKDAVKLAALPEADAAGGTEVWVLPLDCELPPALVHDVLALLPRREAAAGELPPHAPHPPPSP